MDRRYVMKPRLVADYLRYGKRPYYFNHEGYMDRLLEGKWFEAEAEHLGTLGVVLGNGFYYVKVEDIQPYTDELILDNRRIVNV